MNVYQLLPSLSPGDAVSNDARALKRVLSEAGYHTELYTELISPKIPRREAKFFDRFPRVTQKDVLIYHLATGTDLNYYIPDLPCQKIVVYHNITPPDFFRPYNSEATALVRYGLDGARYLADKVDYCLAVSEFNKRDLIAMGYTCPIDVRPVLIPFEDYRTKPDPLICRRFGEDGRENVLFVGRLAPNKKQEDIMRAFCQYKRTYAPDARLILVGTGGDQMRLYEQRLRLYAKRLGLEDDIFFTGHISFPEILAYYSTASVFLCESEHEGFCVPLLEAMCFDVPVVAYDSCAIADTLGGAGVLLSDKDPAFVAGVLDRLRRDKPLRDGIVAGQRARLSDFSYDRIKTLFLSQLSAFLASKGLR